MHDKSRTGGALLEQSEKVRDEKAFLGLGYDTKGVPVEVAGIVLLGKGFTEYTLFIVDEFLRLNGKRESEVLKGKELLEESVNRLCHCYDVRVNCRTASQLMSTTAYKRVYAATKEAVKKAGVEERLLATIPPQHQYDEQAKSYPFHEVACVAALANQGYKLKIGPEKERFYDDVIASVGTNVSFAYLQPAYALGTRTTVSVVHYAPNNHGGGQRLYLHDTPARVEAKVLQGNEESLRALDRLARVAAKARGVELDVLAPTRLKRLKRQVLERVNEHVIRPFQEVTR